MENYHVFIILVCVVCAIIGAGIGERKGQRSAGFALGLFFGPIGVLFTLLLSDARGQVCRICKKTSSKNTSFCAHCGNSFSDDLCVECPFCKREFKITN
jgi:hypothetical protein